MESLNLSRYQKFFVSNVVLPRFEVVEEPVLSLPPFIIDNVFEAMEEGAKALLLGELLGKQIQPDLVV